MGPDRPIHLHLYATRIGEVFSKAVVTGDLTPTLEVDVEVQGGKGVVSCRLEDEEGKVIKVQTGEAGKKCLRWDLKGLVELWWPNGHGKAHRYKLTVELFGKVRHSCVVPKMCSLENLPTNILQKDKVIDTYSYKIGFRRALLVQEPLIDQPGTSFVFEINNQRIFAGGMCLRST